MLNCFNSHPHNNFKGTCLEHLTFTFKIGVRLVFSGIIFIIHGIFPFIPIPKRVNFSESIKFLTKVNDHLSNK